MSHRPVRITVDVAHLREGDNDQREDIKKENMKISICHYSFHRAWAAENWDACRLAEEVKRIGVGAIDFHVGFLGSTERAAEMVTAALDKTGLELSGLSLSTNFGHDDPGRVSKEIEKTISWMRIAKEVRAPVSRIFGVPLPSGLAVHVRGDGAADEARRKLKERVAAALEEVTREAESLDLVLALENHHGFPATAEEQVELIERMNSKCFRATVDVGNYMCADQAPEVGTAIAAPYAAYVHVKDFARVADESIASGWRLEPRAVGRGDVNQAACLQILKDAGFDGFVAIEYEGHENERIGVAQSVEFLNTIISNGAHMFTEIYECR